MKRNLFNFVIVFILSGLLAACGSSGGGGGTTPEKVSKIVSGVASKGPIKDGTVTVYALNADGSQGDILGTGTTASDGSGSFSVNIGEYRGDVLIKVTGGTYRDEATGNEGQPNPGLRAVLTNVTGNVAVAVTPLTEAAVRKAEAAGGLTSANIDQANASVSALLNGVDITKTKPVDVRDPASSGGSAEQKNYGLVLAAISKMVATGEAPDIDTAIQKIADDLADNKLDTTATGLSDALEGVISDSTINKTGVTLNDPVVSDLIKNISEGAPPPTLYTISGTVTSGGVGLSEVTVTLSGTASGTATTDDNGNYSFANLSNGSYTVTPGRSGYTFSPVDANVTLNGANGTQNFNATVIPNVEPPSVYTISGTVTTGGVGLSDVTITLSGTAAGIVTTDANGNYSFANLQNGSYTVTAGRSGYTFSPVDVNVTLNGANGSQNFTATLITPPPPSVYTISGTVTFEGAGLSNVTMILSGTASGTATTDANGNYSFADLQNGIYSVTPSRSGYTFSPAIAGLTVNGGNVTRDFTATATSAPIAYSISGTVNYTGGKTGRIYINAGWDTGTSIEGPGPFSIRGVQPSTYTLDAYLDHLGTGARNAANPSGVSAVVSVTSSDVNGVVITLSDPVAPSPTTPTGLSVHPGNGSALILWDSVRDSSDNEIADSYTIEWSASPTFDTTEGSVTVIARRDTHYFQSGLTNGSELYYRIRAQAGALASAPSPLVGPVTIGAVTGANTVSGTVTLPGTATGPLYVGLYSESLGVATFYFTRIASPANGVTYTISGVPNGMYDLFAIVDNNNDGVINAGDMSNTNGGASLVTVSNASLTGQDIVLTDANTSVEVKTMHWIYGTDYYELNFDIRTRMKMPVNVTLISGPNVAAPVDFQKGDDYNEYDYWIWLDSVRPIVGDAYTFVIEYSDGSTETLTRSVTGIVDSFATPVDPVGTTCGADCLSSGGTPTTPTFNWAPPSSGPSSYGFFIEVSGPDPAGNGWMNWEYPDSNAGMPGTQTSVPYNVDGRASLSSLIPGQTYYWQVSVQDANGNQAISQQVNYTPPAMPAIYNISGTVTSGGEGLSDVTMTLSGAASGSTNTDASGNYSFVNLQDGSYTITPGKSGYTFNPISVATSVNGADVFHDFSAIPTSEPLYVISGVVTVGGVGLPDATITLSGTANGTITTDANGNYSFANLPNGSYTLIPHLSGYVFNPGVASVDVNGTDAVQDFSASYRPDLRTYTISGTVNYAGGKTGRIYINAGWDTGTSIEGPGPFTIRGVQPYTDTLNAYLDHLGNGARNAANPSGTATISMNYGDVSGVVITLTDPVVPPPPTPTGLSVHPADGSALIFWDVVRDANDVEIADSYTIEWSTSPALDPMEGTVSSVSVVAQSDAHYFQSGLTNGRVLYYRIRSQAGILASAPSPIVGPVTIGAGTGANTISGTVTFPGIATGPLGVGLYSDALGIVSVYFTSIPSPVSGVPYSISGVPNGNYYLFAFVDNNNDGVINTGDIRNTNGKASLVTISNADLTGQDIVLTANSSVAVRTMHWTYGMDGYDYYWLEFEFYAGVKMPVDVTLVSGPNVSVPMDFQKDQEGGNYHQWIGGWSVQPTAGDTYTFAVEYSDGTTEILTTTVATVLDSFATPVDPVGTTCGADCLSLSGTPTTPTFNWTAPSGPSSYTYFINVYGPDNTGYGWMNWYYPDGDLGMPNTQTSVPYNIDGNSSLLSLIPGETYYWEILVRDADGNQAIRQVSYTPPVETPAIVGTWYGGDPMNTGFYVITFFADGTYVMADDDDSTTNNDPNSPVCQAGMEHGIYTWDPATGSFFANPTMTDTNGECGFSTGDGLGTTATITINGNTLNFTIDGVGISLPRLLPDAANPIVGTWYDGVPGQADNIVVISFFADGTYVFAQDGEIDPGGSGQDGMEHGSYTLDQATGTFTASASLTDTNGDWGINNISSADSVSAAVSNDTLTFTFPGAVYTVTRLVP